MEIHNAHLIKKSLEAMDSSLILSYNPNLERETYTGSRRFHRLGKITDIKFLITSTRPELPRSKMQSGESGESGRVDLSIRSCFGSWGGDG